MTCCDTWIIKQFYRVLVGLLFILGNLCGGSFGWTTTTTTAATRGHVGRYSIPYHIDRRAPSRVIELSTSRRRSDVSLRSSSSTEGESFEEGQSQPQDDASSPQHEQDIFVIAWEGVLVSTTSRNIKLGLSAACEVWPELEIMTMGADLQWLYNKLEALKHVLAPFDHAYHPAVEYGLAIRMLLEEQELDLGKSNGSKGKYGSRFHPSKECQAFPKRTDEIETKPRQQRPLTVGEIEINWRETLREAAWIRYAQEEERGVNPLDLLQQAIQEFDTAEVEPLRITPDLASILQHQRDDDSLRIVVGVYHELDLLAAETSLREAGISVVPYNSLEELTRDITNGSARLSAAVALVCLNNPRSTVRQMLKEAPDQSTVHVMKAFWCTLQPFTPLFGNSIPRNPEEPLSEQLQRVRQGTGKSIERHCQLQLCLCEWTDTCHPNDIASATMNPWATTWSQDDFLAATLYSPSSTHASDQILQ